MAKNAHRVKMIGKRTENIVCVPESLANFYPRRPEWKNKPGRNRPRKWKKRWKQGEFNHSFTRRRNPWGRKEKNGDTISGDQKTVPEFIKSNVKKAVKKGQETKRWEKTVPTASCFNFPGIKTVWQLVEMKQLEEMRDFLPLVSLSIQFVKLKEVEEIRDSRHSSSIKNIKMKKK